MNRNDMKRIVYFLVSLLGFTKLQHKILLILFFHLL